jgi:hypothetical protein
LAIRFLPLFCRAWRDPTLVVEERLAHRNPTGEDVCHQTSVVRRAALRRCGGNDWKGKVYFAAEKRLSNEFGETIGCAPATRLLPLEAGAGEDVAAAVSVAAGPGLAEACRVFALAGFGRASAIFDLVGVTGCGTGVVVAVVSAEALLRPTL